MPLLLDTGYSSRARQRDNEHKACLMELPRAIADESQTALFVLADGLPACPDPSRTAHTAVHVFIESYRAAPEIWAPRKSLQESYAAANQFLLSGNSHALAASLSALLLHQRRWLLGHAGDTRVWLFRDNQLKLLTRDHVLPDLRQTPQFSRAVGLVPQIEADFFEGDLQEGDVFALTSNGVHGALDSTVLMSCLIGDKKVQLMAETLTERAQAAAKTDNPRACVVRVERLPRKISRNGGATLAMLALPMIGDTVDGWRIDELVQKSSRYRLYRAVDANDQKVLLKFPNPRFGDSAAFIDGFLREEWIARRVDSPYLVRALPTVPGQRTALYTVLAHHQGEDLSSRIKRKRGLPLAEGLMLGKQLLDVLELLRRADVPHPDIRPKNLLFDKRNGRLLLRNAGASLLGHRRDTEESARISAGVLSYLAPELLEGRDASVHSDIYTAGVVLFRMFTGLYPYGTIKSANHAAFGEVDVAATRKANLPAWLVDILSRACAFDPEKRYADAQAFARALTDGETRAAQAPPAPPPLTASPASARRFAVWEWALVGVLLTGLVIYLVLALL